VYKQQTSGEDLDKTIQRAVEFMGQMSKEATVGDEACPLCDRDGSFEKALERVSQ